MLEQRMLVPALVGLVVGIVVGLLVGNILMGVVLGLFLGTTSVIRRRVADKMLAQRRGDDERRDGVR